MKGKFVGYGKSKSCNRLKIGWAMVFVGIVIISLSGCQSRSRIGSARRGINLTLDSHNHYVLHLPGEWKVDFYNKGQLYLVGANPGEGKPIELQLTTWGGIYKKERPEEPTFYGLPFHNHGRSGVGNLYFFPGGYGEIVLSGDPSACTKLERRILAQTKKLGFRGGSNEYCEKLAESFTMKAPSDLVDPKGLPKYVAHLLAEPGVPKPLQKFYRGNCSSGNYAYKKIGPVILSGSPRQAVFLKGKYALLYAGPRGVLLKKDAKAALQVLVKSVAIHYQDNASIRNKFFTEHDGGGNRSIVRYVYFGAESLCSLTIAGDKEAVQGLENSLRTPAADVALKQMAPDRSYPAKGFEAVQVFTGLNVLIAHAQAQPPN